MNNGEKDEFLFVLTLLYLRDNNLLEIKTVGHYYKNKYREYLSHKLSLSELNNLNKDEIKKICLKCKIYKSPSLSKADVYINFKGTSLKSERKGNPSFLNHTHRAGIEKVCNRINLDINPIDICIENYLNLRLSNLISEDVKMSSKENPFEPIKEDLIKLLTYFLFEGTSKGDSPYPAKQLISFTNPTDYLTWSEYTPESAAKKYIDNIVISIRSKGMPKSYNHNSISERDISIKKWTIFINGKFKGSLHIR